MSAELTRRSQPRFVAEVAAWACDERQVTAQHRYWVGFTFDGELQVFGLHSWRDALNFYEDIKLQATGHSYLMNRRPSSQDPRELERCSQAVHISGADSPDKQRWRKKTVELHDLVRDVPKLPGLEPIEGFLDENLGPYRVFYTNMGFGFFPVNGGTQTLLTFEGHEGGVMLGLASKGAYTHEMALGYNLKGVNLFSENHPRHCILTEGGKPIGFYAEELVIPECARASLGDDYQLSGARKLVAIQMPSEEL